MEKCGYCPSTRAALKSPQVRREIIAAPQESDNDESDTEIESNVDPITKMYEDIEGQVCFRVSMLTSLSTNY